MSRNDVGRIQRLLGGFVKGFGLWAALTTTGTTFTTNTNMFAVVSIVPSWFRSVLAASVRTLYDSEALRDSHQLHAAFALVACSFDE